MTKQEGFTHIGPTAETAMQRNRPEVGNNAGPTGVALSLSDTNRVAAWLAKQAPVDMDKAAVSRASQHGVGLRVRYEWRYPEGQPSYPVAVGCEISPDGNHEAALADLRNFLTPAPIREIEAWLAVLSVTVAKRRDDEFTEELRLTTYAARLSRYPADVAREVTHATYGFWPTWEEMEKRCKALTGPRLQMIAALERGPAKPEVRREPTQEERDRIQAMVNEMFPNETAHDRQRAVDEALKGKCMIGRHQEQGTA